MITTEVFLNEVDHIGSALCDGIKTATLNLCLMSGCVCIYTSVREDFMHYLHFNTCTHNSIKQSSNHRIVLCLCGNAVHFL